jgi:hypothetical protein
MPEEQFTLIDKNQMGRRSYQCRDCGWVTGFVTPAEYLIAAKQHACAQVVTARQVWAQRELGQRPNPHKQYATPLLAELVRTFAHHSDELDAIDLAFQDLAGVKETPR